MELPREEAQIKKFTPRPPDAPDGTWRMQQSDVDRVQEFRKCIECFLCQDVCHVLREHHEEDAFVGPRHFVYTAALEMHPLDVADRIPSSSSGQGIGFCNITKCCTKVCPESITITDNAIIPLKERVVDEFYDPLGRLVKLFSRRRLGSSGATDGSYPMYSLKPIARAAIPAALKRRSTIGSSTIRRRRRASASTCSRSSPTISRR